MHLRKLLPTIKRSFFQGLRASQFYVELIFLMIWGMMISVIGTVGHSGMAGWTGRLIVPVATIHSAGLQKFPWE